MSRWTMEIVKEISFRAARQLKRHELSVAENQKLFGRRVRWHGHEFKLRVHLRGDLNGRSGVIFERERLDRILRIAVTETVDGKNLNEMFPNSSHEGLARSLYLRLKPLFPEEMLTRVSISTTDAAAVYPSY